jgi:hypothetical protein
METYGFETDPFSGYVYHESIPGQYENENGQFSRNEGGPFSGYGYYSIQGRYENGQFVRNDVHDHPGVVPRYSDPGALQNYHTKPTWNLGNPSLPPTMLCQFAAYGCRSTFESMTECDRHVRIYHVKPGYWLRKKCQDPETEYETFHRLPIRGSRKNGWSQLGLNDIPSQSSCFFCTEKFSGVDSWGKRMDHIASHLQWIRIGLRIENKQEWYDDPELQDWLLKMRMIDDDARVGWRICEALPQVKKTKATSSTEDPTTSNELTGPGQIVQQSPISDGNYILERGNSTGIVLSPSMEAYPNVLSPEDVELTESAISLPVTQTNLYIHGASSSGSTLSWAEYVVNSTQSTSFGGIEAPGDVLLSTAIDSLSPTAPSNYNNFEESANSCDSDIDDCVSEGTEYTDEGSSDPTRSLSGNTTLSAILREFRRDVLTQLSSKFPEFTITGASFKSYAAGSSDSSAHANRDSSQLSPSNSNSGQPSDSRGRSKGLGSSGNTNSNDENESNDPGPEKKLLISQASIRTKVWRLACPFFKLDPQKHQRWKSCTGPGWETVHRAK